LTVPGRVGLTAGAGGESGNQEAEDVGNLNDFADLERERQAAFARFRTRTFGFAVQPLRRLGVTADHITLAGLLLLIPYAWWFGSRPGWAVGCLVLAILLDGLDGVYARVTGTATEGGAFTDVCADHVGLVVTVLLLIQHGLAPPVLAAYYAVLYVTVVSLSVFQNFVGVPLQPVLRSKFPLYGLVVVHAVSGWNGFAWLMAVFSLTMTVNALQSFFRLKRHFGRIVSGAPGPDGSGDGSDSQLPP
jgi:phosphatidylglycerophosphate synthase